MRSEDESLRTLEAVLKIASQGVDGAEVTLSGGGLGLTRFFDNEVHQAMEVNRDSIGIRVLLGGKSARVETTDVSMEGIQAAARQARMMAQYMPEPERAIELPGPQKYWATDAFDPQTATVTSLDRMAVVGRILMQAQKKGLTASGYVTTGNGSLGDGMHGDAPYAIANTRGVAAYHPQTSAAASVTVCRGDASGWAEASAHSVGQIDVQHLADVATRKAQRQRSIRSIGPGAYTVVLEPAAVASLLDFIASSCGADDMDHERSFLSGAVGEKIVDESVCISDNHAHALHRGCPFDAEGVAKRAVSIVEDGVVRGPVYNLASAARHGVEPTGHSTSSLVFGDAERAEHLVMTGGEGTTDDLVDSMDSGVLITRFWYTQVHDPRKLTLTGVTRDGTFLVEDGRVVSALRDMRFNVSLIDVLNSVEAMSKAVFAGGMVVPAMKVRGFRLTSTISD